MKKKLFSIITMVLEVVVIAGLFFPYLAGENRSIWQSFGNAFAIVGVSFSVVGFLGSLFKKNELNYLACGYFLGIHIYNIAEPSTNLQLQMLGVGFYIQAGGVFLLLLATFISSFLNNNKNQVVQEKKNNMEVKTTVNNGQMNMPVNSFKSLPVETKEEEKTMPKPDLLSGVKQNDDSLFVNTNLFVSTPEANPTVSTGPSLLDHITVPSGNNNPPQMIGGPEQNSMPTGMMAPPMGMPGPVPAPEQNGMPMGMMAPPMGMPGPMPAPEQNSMPMGMMAPPMGMPGPMPAPEQNSMPTGMMAPPVEAPGTLGPVPAPEQNSMPAGMMAPPVETPGMLGPVPALEQNSMPAEMMAPPAAPEIAAPAPVVEQNSMPAEMMAPPVAPEVAAPAPVVEQNSMPAEMMAPPAAPEIAAPAPAPEQNSMPTGMLAPAAPAPMPEQNSMPQAMILTQDVSATPQLGGILGGLPEPSKEGGTDIHSIMNEGPSVEEQLKMFNAAQQAPNQDVPKPDLLAGSNLSGVLGNNN